MARYAPHCHTSSIYVFLLLSTMLLHPRMAFSRNPLGRVLVVLEELVLLLLYFQTSLPCAPSPLPSLVLYLLDDCSTPRRPPLSDDFFYSNLYHCQLNCELMVPQMCGVAHVVYCCRIFLRMVPFLEAAERA